MAGPVGRVPLLWPTLAGGGFGFFHVAAWKRWWRACSVATANGADEGAPGPPTWRRVVLSAT